MTNRERYLGYKERGICVYCKTAPAEDGKTTCRVCREKQRIQTAEKRAALIKMRICTECGSQRVFGKKKICPECAAKKYESNRKYKKDKEKERQYHKDRRERLKAAGICTKCAKRQAEPGKCKCGICNAKERKRAKEYRGFGIDRSERPAYGMCYFCGTHIESGKICSSCRDRIMKNLPDERNSDVWRRDEHARIMSLVASKASNG